MKARRSQRTLAAATFSLMMGTVSDWAIYCCPRKFLNVTDVFFQTQETSVARGPEYFWKKIPNPEKLPKRQIFEPSNHHQITINFH